MFIRVALASTIFLFSTTTSMTAVAAPSGMVPGGSYLNTCRDVRFDPATNVLTADCESSGSGTLLAGEKLQTAPFNVGGCVENSIWNDSNVLYCLAAKAWGHDHVIPKGSYIDTCTNRRVINAVLIAECGNGGGNSTNATLNLNGCKWGGDIANDRGTLRCEPIIAGMRQEFQPSETPPSEAQPVVKPVAVQPLVKPAIIGPVAPADDGTTGKDGKKKKRDKGERG